MEGDVSTSAGYYTTSSVLSPGQPGPLFRLKPGTDAATPSTNGIIAQNLLRLSVLLEDETYRRLAKETCDAFSVEIMQHPFLFVGMLDVIVGLEVGVKSVIGVLGHSETRTGVESTVGGGTARDFTSARQAVVQKIRDEAGAAVATSSAVVSLVDVRASTKDTENKSAWLRRRNTLLKDLQPGASGKNFMLVCESGLCRTVDL